MNPEIRELHEGDIAEAARLLRVEFPRRTESYWRTGLERLARREPPANTVRLGYCLCDEGAMRGVVLAIPSLHKNRGAARTFVNISSWCVSPSHRGVAAKKLYEHASSRHPDVTYTNLSAAAHTLRAITSIGFQPWTSGQLLCVGFRSSAGRRTLVPVERAEAAGLPESVAQTLVEHASLGCVAFCIETRAKLAPFIFLRRRVNLLPCAQLIYCEALEDLIDNGRAISMALARRGYPVMIVDSNGPVSGLPGRYFPGKAAKYYKGPVPELAVDHTFSEMVYLGF